MCVAGAGTCQSVLSAGWGKRGECASHAAARYAIHRNAVLWESSDDGLAAEPGLCGQSEAGDPADAADGDCGHLYEAAAEPGGRGTRDLSVSLARRADRAGQPCVEHR